MLRSLSLVVCLFVSSAASAGPSKVKYTESKERKAAIAKGAARALFSGGCFWGMEHYFSKAKGVLAVTSGMTSAKGVDPVETIEVLYDKNKTTYETLARLFFEIHDPTQRDRQGPDVGRRYRSVAFTGSKAEVATVERLIGLLKAKGFKVVTEVLPQGTFKPASDYHQDYYQRTGGTPYCHARTKRF